MNCFKSQLWKFKRNIFPTNYRNIRDKYRLQYSTAMVKNYSLHHCGRWKTNQQTSEQNGDSDAGRNTQSLLRNCKHPSAVVLHRRKVLRRSVVEQMWRFGWQQVRLPRQALQWCPDRKLSHLLVRGVWRLELWGGHVTTGLHGASFRSNHRRKR